MKNILGVKVGHHEPGAAIITKDGKISAIAEERLNRIKHSTGVFPKLAIGYVLSARGLTYRDVDLIVLDRVVDADVEKIFKDSAPKELLDIPIKTINHHDSHAASACFCSGFSESLVVIVDGAGEAIPKRGNIYKVEAMSVYDFRRGKLQLIDKTSHERNMRTNRYIHSTGIGSYIRRLLDT